jgi:flagellin-specific chaperone FliS
MAEPTLAELIIIAKQKLEMAKEALGKTPYTILADQTSITKVQDIINPLQAVIDLVEE